MKRLLIGAAALVSLGGAAPAETVVRLGGTGGSPYEQQLVELKAHIVKRHPKILEQKTDFDRAVFLRNVVYRDVPMKPTPTGFVFDEPFEAWKTSTKGRAGHVCGGLSILYMQALKAFGLQSRQIGMFASVNEKEAPLDSHVSVDVFADGRWVAMDPTFNISLRGADGRPLSWEEARAEMLAKRGVDATDNGQGVKKKRSVARYYIGLDELVRYMVVGIAPEIEKPRPLDGWDCRLSYKERPDYDYCGSAASGTYRLIHKARAPA